MTTTNLIRTLAARFPDVLPLLSEEAQRMAGVMPDVKTAEHMESVLMGYIYDLYAERISQGEFVDRLAVLVEEQLRRAWNEGMRANELDPKADMIPEWEQEYQDIVTAEYAFIDQFAADIVSQQYTLPQLQARAGVWANRYRDVVNRAIIVTADSKSRLMWVVGPTEHCSTCQQLNGVVAFAREWDALNVHPQQPQNDMLECGGFRCQCELKPTDRRRSPDAYNTIMDIVSR